MLIGLSMGGRNAMYVASKRPDAVQKLVIVDIGSEISRRASEAPAGPPEPESWKAMSRRPNICTGDGCGPARRRRLGQGQPLQAVLEDRVDMPVGAGPDVTERMAKELPQGRFVEIPRAVHTLHEDNPEAVLAALREFLTF